MLVVLNQVDRLEPGRRHAVPRRPAPAPRPPTAFADAQVLTTSARTGPGSTSCGSGWPTPSPDAPPCTTASGPTWPARRGRCASGVGDSEPALEGESSYAGLVTALGRAAGVPVVLDAVEADYQRAALARTGWLFTRWRRHLSADPLARLRLGTPGAVGVQGLRGDDVRGDVRALLGRSSLPAPSAGARSAVRLATDDVTDRASQGLPLAWARAVRESAAPDRTRLEEQLDRAVTGDLAAGARPGLLEGPRRPPGRSGRGRGAGSAVALAVLVVGWLRLPTLPGVDLGPLPLWLVLLVVGVGGGLGLAALGRVLARRGAVRRRRLVQRRLDEALTVVAVEQVVDPVRAVLARHARVRDRLDGVLAGGR